MNKLEGGRLVEARLAAICQRRKPVIINWFFKFQDCVIMTKFAVDWASLKLWWISPCFNIRLELLRGHSFRPQSKLEASVWALFLSIVNVVSFSENQVWRYKNCASKLCLFGFSLEGHCTYRSMQNCFEMLLWDGEQWILAKRVV